MWHREDTTCVFKNVKPVSVAFHLGGLWDEGKKKVRDVERNEFSLYFIAPTQ